MNKRYFDFDFELRDTEEFRSFAIRLPDGTVEETNDLMEAVVNQCCETDIESDYGVHDFGGSPAKGISTLGFCSYEVAADKIPELMNLWRDFFVERYGADKVGKVVELPATIPSEDRKARYAYLLAQEGAVSLAAHPVSEPPEPSC